MRGSQDKSPAVFEQPELAARGIAEIESRDRLSAYLDRSRRLRRRLRRAGGGDQIERGGNEGGDDRSGKPCVNTPYRRATAAHASSLRCCRVSAGNCSSNSSASLSVMAPPSSSASTMVTARR